MLQDTDLQAGPLVVASASSRLRQHWTDALAGLAPIHQATDLPSLEAILRHHRPLGVILDPDLAGGVQGIPLLQQAFPLTRVMAATRTDSLAEAAEAIRFGAHGHIQQEDDAVLIRRAMRFMSEEGLWAKRRVLENLVAEHMRGAPNDALARPPSALNTPDVLSGREQEVAVLVADGLCYKAIARRLGIAENTVRNHVRHIFKKLVISDRLQLALMIRETPLFTHREPAAIP